MAPALREAQIGGGEVSDGADAHDGGQLIGVVGGTKDMRSQDGVGGLSSSCCGMCCWQSR